MSGAYSKKDLETMKKLMFQNLVVHCDLLIKESLNYSLQVDISKEQIEVGSPRFYLYG